MQQRARIASGRKAEGSDAACAPGVRQRTRPGLTAWLTRLGGVAALALLGSCVSQAPGGSGPHAGGACRNVIHADVVAIEQAYVLNRFAAFVPAGMLYALRHDVVPADASRPLGPGNAMLRPDKRPRPLVFCASTKATACRSPSRTCLIPNGRASFTSLAGRRMKPQFSLI